LLLIRTLSISFGFLSVTVVKLDYKNGVYEMADHTEGFHLSCVNKLCRICSGREKQRLEKRKFGFSCVSKKEEILLLFCVDISNDISGVHPPNLCSKCYRKNN
jgi:hypothetical protein